MFICFWNVAPLVKLTYTNGPWKHFLWSFYLLLDFIRPVCLPSKDLTLPENKPPQFSMYAVGWGATSNTTRRSNVKLHVKLPFIEREVSNCNLQHLLLSKFIKWSTSIKELWGRGVFQIKMTPVSLHCPSPLPLHCSPNAPSLPLLLLFHCLSSCSFIAPLHCPFNAPLPCPVIAHPSHSNI